MRKAIALVILALILAVLGGWLTVGKPVLKGIKLRWGSVNRSYTEIIADINVYNPNPFSIPLKDVRAYVFMNGIEVGKGHAIRCNIGPKSNSTIVLAIYIDNSKIPKWWVSHVRNGERSVVKVKAYLVFPFGITYPIEFSKVFKTDILSRISVNKPVNIKEGPITVTLESAKSEWGNVNESYTEIITLARIRNDNPFPLPITKVHYIVDMNGIRVADGYSEVATIIPPNSEATIPLKTLINNEKMIEWWVSHIKNGEKSVVVVTLKPFVRVDGRTLEFTLLKERFIFKTNLLG